ncbi:MAG: PaaI family thioesterase [Desulfobulbus sp.]|uniref:PaaI family thioesterase n=1 Tax=Desulfobulbus sp. TaxID=895 RepID=UPI00283F7A32|nr:PaaI family thioesterase [Desulfobulbus sp.]MDR2551089.1 PaaI family thioesterase [Desulfobulbus sp.]
MPVNRTDLKPIVNLESQTCFGCGTGNPVGLHMAFHTDNQRLYSFVSVPPAMAGWDRTVHGGILSTILDEIMGWSVIYLLGKIGVTKSMTVEFRKPVQVEDQLTAVGTIGETISDRQITVSGEIYNGDQVLCARAEGTFAALSAQAAVRLGVMSADYMKRFAPVLQQRGGA